MTILNNDEQEEAVLRDHQLLEQKNNECEIQILQLNALESSKSIDGYIKLIENLEIKFANLHSNNIDRLDDISSALHANQLKFDSLIAKYQTTHFEMDKLRHDNLTQQQQHNAEMHIIKEEVTVI